MSQPDHASAVSHDDHDNDHDHGTSHFSENKVFVYLLVLTMLEVGWGLAGKHMGFNRLMLWGGLMFFAFYKGWLIAVYFMHLKFEGWVVKSLIAPTPFLVMVIFGYVMPDVANHHGRLIHPVGSKVDPATGQVIEDMHEGWHPTHPGEEHGEAPAPTETPAAEGAAH
jgi:caa(3)-type oxidase subunit IV